MSASQTRAGGAAIRFGEVTTLFESTDDSTGIQQRVGTTTIYVTHDQVEAMGMGDRIAVLDHGRVR